MAALKTLKFIKNGATSMVEFPDGMLKQLRLDTVMEYTIVIGLLHQDSVSNWTRIKMSSTLNQYLSTVILSKYGLKTREIPNTADLLPYYYLLIHSIFIIHKIINS